MSKQITIVGAGLVGSLLSIYLAKKGYKIKIYERRPDMRKTSIGAGKSINLALSDRGWKALEGIGIADEIRKVGIPMYGRMIHNEKGELSYLPYGKEGQAIYSVSRGGINCKLMDLAEEQKNISLFFNERCGEVDIKNKQAHFENTQSKAKTTVDSDIIFGADGAFSAVRLQMQLSTDRFEYKQSYINCGYKELTIPASKDGSFLMEKNALHIWPRKEFMMIALPNLDGSFTCTLFFPFEGSASFSALQSKEAVKQFFKTTFPDAVSLMPDLLEDYFHNPTSSLVTVKCFPWIVEDRLALIGDAAHAIVPFFGQGMNCGFEDCTILSQLMDKYQEDWATILHEYQLLRKPNADAIADLAIENFIEMRDRIADPKFLLQKKIEAKISEKHPGKWLPLYSMVTFSPHIPYAQAFQEGKKQAEIMGKVMKFPEIEKEWDSEKIENFILKNL